MKERLLLITNVLLILAATLIFAGVQTALWFHVFGYFPAPNLWIMGLLFIALNRTLNEAILVTYLLSIVVSTMTSMADGVLYITCIALLFLTRSFRQRFFWSGSSYLMLLGGVGTLFFHILRYFVSAWFETKQYYMPDIFSWLLESALTALVAPWINWIYNRIDILTGREGFNVTASEGATT